MKNQYIFLIGIVLAPYINSTSFADLERTKHSYSSKLFNKRNSVILAGAIVGLLASNYLAIPKKKIEEKKLSQKKRLKLNTSQNKQLKLKLT